MSLFGAEIRRLLKRRFIRYMCVVGLLILAAVATGMFLTHQKAGPEQVVAAQQEAERQYQDQIRWADQFRAECEAAKASGTSSPDKGFPEDCSEMTPPAREDFRAEWFMPPSFDFRDDFGNMIFTFAAILAMVAFLVGASFVGVEWSSGGMMNLLLWRPRRLPVLLTKLGALVAGLTALTVVTGALWTGVFWLTGTLRGSTERMTPGAWQSFGLTGLRAVALILALGVIGFGLASMGRRTAMALGALVGVVVVFQFGLGIILEMAEVKFAEAYLLPVWGLAWMQKKFTLENYRSCEASPFGGCQPETLDLTWPMAGGLMAAGVVLVLGAAMWTMRSRDVT